MPCGEKGWFGLMNIAENIVRVWTIMKGCRLPVRRSEYPCTGP